MSVMVNSRDNKTVNVYTVPEVDAMKAQGSYIGAGGPAQGNPGSYAHHISLRFQPKYVVISEVTTGALALAIRDTAQLIVPAPPIPVNAVVTDGSVMVPGPGPVLVPSPANLHILFSPTGFYVTDVILDQAVPAPLVYNYFAVR